MNADRSKEVKVHTLSSASLSMFMALRLMFLSSLSLVSSSLFSLWPASLGLFTLKSYAELAWPKRCRSDEIQSFSASMRVTCVTPDQHALFLHTLSFSLSFIDISLSMSHSPSVSVSLHPYTSRKKNSPDLLKSRILKPKT